MARGRDRSEGPQIVLLLIIGEATEQALLGEDFSIINACVVIGTLMTLELGLSLLKARWPRLDPVLEQCAVRHERVDLGGVLAAAREKHGLERLDQIKSAVLERSGGISIVPAEKG